MRRIFLLTCMLLLLFSLSCKRNVHDIDLDSIQQNLTIKRFEKDLFSIEQDSLQGSVPKLMASYGTFMDLFGEKLISIGPTDDPNYFSYLYSFVTNSMIKESYKKVQEVFPETKLLSKEFEPAFKRYHYYFPDRVIPRIYTFVSGYNQSIVITDSILAIGLERYLGADFSDYSGLGIPAYLVRNMKPEKISSDAMRSWAIGEFPFNDSIDNLACNMIYEGMLMYFTHMMLPDQPDSLIFGFTPDQMKWCKKNEKMMWTYLIENKLLFNTDSFLIGKMVNSAPFTSGFPQESPGRSVVWLGYRIIHSYLKNNSAATFPQIMNTKDYQQILNKSKYQP